jgi:hypothetical protein
MFPFGVHPPRFLQDDRQTFFPDYLPTLDHDYQWISSPEGHSTSLDEDHSTLQFEGCSTAHDYFLKVHDCLPNGRDCLPKVQDYHHPTLHVCLPKVHDGFPKIRGGLLDVHLYLL